MMPLVVFLCISHRRSSLFFSESWSGMCLNGGSCLLRCEFVSYIACALVDLSSSLGFVITCFLCG